MRKWKERVCEKGFFYRLVSGKKDYIMRNVLLLIVL
jgi:hypothetical protein